jgi:ribose transport system permease protein
LGCWGPFLGILGFASLVVVMIMFAIRDPGKLVAQGLMILLTAIFYGLLSASN